MNSLGPMDSEYSLVNAESKFIAALGAVKDNEPSFEMLIYNYTRLPLVEKNRQIRFIVSRLLDNETLDSIIALFDEFEKYLLALGKRDHFVHQFEVYLLGINLINLIIDRDKMSFSEFPDNSTVYYFWALTSLFHDFGYPFGVAPLFNQKFGKLFEKFKMKNLASVYKQVNPQPKLFEEYSLCHVMLRSDSLTFVDGCINLHDVMLEQMAYDLQMDHDETTRLQSLLIENRPDHGYVSAILLLSIILESRVKSSSCDDFLKYISGEHFKFLKIAASAICLHSIPSDFFRNIDFKFNKFGYLLFLLDNLQDWNRCVFPNDGYPSYELLDFNLSTSTMDIEYAIKSRGWNKDMLRDIKKEIVEKERRFKTIKSPDPALGITLNISYKFSPENINSPMNIVVNI